MLGTFFGWVVLGLVAGVLARMLHPGKDPMGLVMTNLLGIGGSLLGGGIAYALHLGTTPYEPAGWILATVGAIVLLAFGWFTTRRAAAV